ncbi:hypothetical protein [Sporomusa aerivorans]|uniref:hypothetical protein n=1 Tax=Sporomusa aerivorans TaxID=204936 RepID=UPI00352B9E01
MENTSQGFHTITIVKKLTKKEASKLIADFQSYSATNDIKFVPIHELKSTDNSDEFIKWLHSSFSKYYIGYYPESKGILWLLRYSNISPGFIKPGEVDKPCSIKATINPKILTGENDYLAAATVDYLEDVEALFNNEAKKISPILGEYRHYSMNRPDYCVNFDLRELKIPCTAERMIKLIKRGNIPTHYFEWVDDNDSAKSSFYLESKSVTINCYWKHKQLKEDFEDCPDLETSQNLIRFEVQCKYLKTYLLSRDIKRKQELSESDVIREMLSEDFCKEIIRKYFNKVIRRGDYFTLNEAIKQVQLQHFSKKKEARLIMELRRTNQFRGIYKVRATLQGEELETFRRTLRDLDYININPVTIPREWNIQRIPNLLNAYDRRVEDELYKKQQEEIDLQILKDYYDERKKRKKKY